MRKPSIRSLTLLASLTFLATLTAGGCRPSPSDAPPVSSAPDAAAGAKSSGESPKDTAASAAATAPECKEIERTQPGSCHPESQGAPAGNP